MCAILKELQCKRLTPHITAAKEKYPQPQRVTCCHPSLGEKPRDVFCGVVHPQALFSLHS